MSSQKRLLFKIIVVGDGGVGKSTMIQRLTTGRFIPQKITIGTDLATINISTEKAMVTLQIWDFGGEKRFRFFLPNYCRGAQGCLLCYDITRYPSFDNLREWYQIVHENTSDPVFILVGEKLDLADIRRSVQYEHAEEFKNKYNLDYFFETSSKSGENNRMIFETLTRSILKKQQLYKNK